MRTDSDGSKLLAMPPGTRPSLPTRLPRQLNWQAVVNDLSNVGRLVHLAMRMVEPDVERIRGELVRARRRAYEHELTIQARRVGCDRAGRLTTGPSLVEMNEASQAEAASIVNTYNFGLAHAIKRIYEETPTANRNTYVRRLGDWEEQRNEFKAQQIAMYTENTARSLAQRDFFTFNAIEGTASLQPRTAKEPICQGWIERGRVPLREAMSNPPPYHLGCPHIWVTHGERVSKAECTDLWMGE